MSGKFYGFVLLLIIALHVVNCRSPRNENHDLCKMPEDRGRCRALIPRWRYNHIAKQCQRFNFGGCGGNGNNFQTEQDCMEKCNGH